jgi:multidrug resistance efflux pump
MKKIIMSIFAVVIVSAIIAGEIRQSNKNAQAASATQVTNNMQVAEVASTAKGVVELHVKLGEKVKKGQLLFSLNQDLQDAQTVIDKSNLKYNEQLLAGAKKLIKNASIPLADYLECVHDHVSAQATYAIDLANIKTSKYYAPFDGTVTNIVRYDGSGLSDNEVEVTQGDVSVHYDNETALVCNRWPGILNLNIKLGDKVKKGQKLFSINTDALKIRAEKDENILAKSKEIFERETKLYNSRNTPLVNLVEAKNNYIQALMEHKKDKITIAQSSGYAPFDGEVTKIYRYSGSGNGECKPVLDITTG